MRVWTSSCFLAAVTLVCWTGLAPNAATATAPSWKDQLQHVTLPVPNYLNGTGVFGRQLQAAISATGASQQQQAQLASDLHNHMYRTWHSMANINRCCSRADLRMDAIEDYDLYTDTCVLLLGQQRHALAFAHAQAGPTNVNCSSTLYKLMYQVTVVGGRLALRAALTRLYGPGAWNVTMLARVLKDNAFPEASMASGQVDADGYSYMRLMGALESSADYVGGTAAHKAMLSASFGEGGQANASHVLKWVLRDSIAYFLLEDLFQQLAALPWFHMCDDLTSWFEGDLHLTSRGRACREASRALPCALWNSTHCLVDSFADNRARRWQSVAAAHQKIAADSDSELDDVSWLWLLTRCFAVVWLVEALLWRPDVLLWWRPKPDVHTPSLMSFLRHRKQQQAVSRLKRQGKTAQAPHGSSSSSPGGSDRSAVLRKHTRARGLALNPPSGPWARDYALHLLSHCWLPRARFAAASYAQLPLLVLSLPVRLGVAVWHTCMKVAAAAAAAARAMVV